jgi:simple sugar transport system ATP-binding protein
VQALQDVSFRVAAGAVHCLAGENGSGKSTVIKLVSGVHRPDAGEIVLGGEAHRSLTPRDAIARGVQVIYQDFSLFPNLTVAENLALPRALYERRRWVSWREVRRRAEAAAARLGVALDLGAEVGRLPVAGRQLVAIARALAADTRLLILDEPTTALTRPEVDRLFTLVCDLQGRGIAAVFVSHKMREMLEIAQTLTVLRNGRVVADGAMRDYDEAAITRAMLGEDLGERRPPRPPAPGAVPRLAVRDLAVPGAVEGVGFALLPGEVVGLAGLLGAGRTELALALFGMRPDHRGTVLVDAREVALRRVADAVRVGIAYVPEDRLTEGLFPAQSIARNLLAATLSRLARWGVLRPGLARRRVRNGLAAMRVATPTAERPVAELSGGNQQRVMIGRWLLTEPRVLILNGPTVGVDVGSKAGIHARIGELAEAEGLAVLTLSDDLPELAQHCHRVLVMHRGRIVDELAGAALTEATLGERLAGLR